MNNLKFLIFLVVISFLPLVSSAEFRIPDIKLGECAELIQTCADCSFVNITTIQFPQRSGIPTLQINEEMTRFVNVYNYTFCNTTAVGEYIYTTIGDPTSTLTTASVSFLVTPTGITLSLSDVLIYSIIFILAILVFSFFFYKTKTTPNEYFKSIYFLLAYLMCVIIIFLVYRLGVDYLPTFTYLNDILFYILLIGIILIFPLFFLIIAYMIKVQFENLSERRLSQRGHSQEEIARRRRWK